MGGSVWNPGGSVIIADAENGSPRQDFVATVEQATFTLTDFNYVPDTGSLRVYRNGVMIQKSLVTENDSTHFTLHTSIKLSAGEIITATGVLGSQDAVIAAALEAKAAAAEAVATLASTVKKTSTTGSAQLPVGTTAERDPLPLEGSIRGNSEAKAFEGYIDGRWQPVGGGQMLGNAEVKAIAYNAKTISENITIPATVNALSAGPIVVNDGFAVTVADGANWIVM